MSQQQDPAQATHAATGDRLHGKVAMVTGAASGIGRATVELFVAEGASVVAADINDAEGAALAQQYQGRVRFIHCDVTEEADIAGAIDTATTRFGGLDILFNNAGAPGMRGTIEEITAAGWDHTMALLLRSVALGIHHGAKAMRTRGGGAIVNTASVAGLTAGAGPTAYSVAKAGVIHLTRATAAELARHRIRVNAICPGLIVTNIFGALPGTDDAARARITEAMQRAAPHAQPLRQAGEARHIAEACLYLVSDASAFVTGTHLVVDGGLTLGPRSAWDPDTPSPVRQAVQAALAPR